MLALITHVAVVTNNGIGHQIVVKDTQLRIVVLMNIMITIEEVVCVGKLISLAITGNVGRPGIVAASLG